MILRSILAKKEKLNFFSFSPPDVRFAPGGVKSDVWLGKANEEIQFFLKCGILAGIIKQG